MKDEAASPLREVPHRMESAPQDNLDHTTAVSRWMRRAPWYHRFSRKFGLQGKLVLCFMLLLSVALGASSYLFLNQSSKQKNHI